MSDDGIQYDFQEELHQACREQEDSDLVQT